MLFKIDADRWNVGRRRNNVVGHLIVRHAAVFPDDIFKQRETDRLGDASFYLSSGEHGIDDSAHFLHGNEIIDVCFVSKLII